MGAAAHLDITGAKGGESKPKTPVEAPDSLSSTNIAKILLAVGEGEFDGIPTDRDIYLDNTPIMDGSGNVNFPGVKWEWRPGSVEQEYIQGIPSIENETNVNVELRSDNPFTRSLSNVQLSAVRVRMSWPRLVSQDSGGNTNGYRIEYAIDIATDGGAYVEAHLGAVDGKSTNGYQRSVRVNLPKATSGWMLRVRRITPNANSGTIGDTMTVAGYTEIIDQKLRYPNTALLYIEFDAQQFQNIPAVTVKCKAKRWPVPTNYDPVNRTYSGVWDGTFKQAWTNNPAFATYGVCVEDRFGLGKRIKPWMVDKWEMYRIAQYCDQMVPNGVGGLEPRYLCDLNLQGRAEAWTLLRDLSAIYRGMVYWGHGSLFMQADMPRAQDIDYVFTRANVIDGDFVYGGAERNTHYSRALVSYDNPANNYDTDVIPVTDLALQRRYRDRPIEISAIGCTRASEAQRRGKWALLSNNQDRTVTFKTGMEGRIPLPGYVIPVADELVAGRPNGGRISSAAGRVVTLDRDTPIKAGDRLILNLPNGTAQARTVQSVAGRAVTVTTEYGVQPEPELQWAIDYDDLAVQLFRVLKTVRTQEGNYEITALEFNPSKFAAIDTGAKLDERPISVIPVTTVQPPASVTLSSTHMIDQGIAVSTMTIAWPAVEGAVAYDVEWRKDSGNWVRLQRAGATSVDVVGIYAGAYLARVRAVSSFDITSIWKSSTLTQLNGKEGLPPAVTFLETESLLFGIKITWGFPVGAGDTQRTELWYSEGTDLDVAIKLSDLAYPQNEHVMQGLRAGQQFYFWARLVDRTGNLGPFFPVAPTVVAGMASADAGAILEQIKDQITESELGKELTSRIDKIDMDGPGSVNERVGAVRNELNEQVAGVNNAIETVKSSVTDARNELQQQLAAVDQEVDAARSELQQQINTVSALAGSLPYNKDKAYTLNQGVLGADGKLYQALKAVPKNNPPPNATYWTDVGQAIVTAAGTATRVGKVETDVSTLDGKTTAQATQINGLQTSLTTTNQNVTAAQQAAEAANTLAGGKGKVIIQAAAPAVADRLAQNLWIDTTGNANTPKRWSGSAWLAVTDKAATDAAAAAASALALAQTKADAMVVNNLTLRVSDAEGKLVAEGQRLDGMQTSLDGKATSAALQQVTSRVAATEGKNATQDQQISSQSSAIVSLTDSVAKKAEASTVQALTNTVNQHGQDLTAQGQSLASINAMLPTLGGENLVYNPSFERQTDNNGMAQYWWYDSSSNVGSRTPSLVASTLAAGVAQRLDVADIPTNGWARVYLRASLKAIKVRPGAVYTASVYMRGTAGLRILAQVYSRDAAGVNGISWAGTRFDAAETWQRVSVTFTATAQTVDVWPAAVVYGGAGVTAGFIEVDQYQLEEGSQASGWRDNGQVEASNQAATAAAVDAMSAKVTQQGADLASVSSKTTSLENSLSTTNGNVTAAQTAAQNAATLAGSKGKVIVQSAAPDVADRVAQNLWIDTSGNANTPKRWTGTAWQAVSDKVATDAAAAAQSALSQVATKAEASALQDLSSRTTSNEGSISSHGQSIVSLQGGLNTTNQNVTTAQQVAQAASDLAGGKGKVLYQSAAPAVADRQAQNLWIDTTSNANTPKRWSGTAWVAVTDKVATDAAAAALSALSQVATKAEASTVQALTNTVTQQGQQLTADGQAITRIDATLTQVKADTAANAQATSALTGRVGSNEAGITSASNQLTELNNSIGEVGGENLVYNSSFEKESTTPGVADEWWYDGSAGSRTPSLVPSTVAPGRAQRLDVTGLSSSTWARVYVKSTRRFKVTPGKTYTASVYMRGTPGLRILLQVYGVNAAGGSTTSWGSPRTDAGETWIRLTHTFTADAATDVVYPSVVVYGGASVGSGFIEADQYQVEAGTRATGWRDNDQVVALQQAAISAAVDSLSSRVTQQGADLASVSSKTTSLENGLTTTNGNVTTAQQAAQAASDAAGAKGKVLYQSTAPIAADRLTQNLWIDTTGNANTPKRWNGTAWVAVTDKVATDAAAAAQSALTQVATKADASALQTLVSTVSQQGAQLNSQATSLTQLKASISQQSDNLVLRGTFEDGLVEPWTNSPSVVGVLAHPSYSKAIVFYVNSFCGTDRKQLLTNGGEQFDLSADVFAGYMTSGQTARLQMQFYDKADTSLGYVDAFVIPAGLGAFKKYSGRITAPAGSVSARFVTRIEPSDGSGRALWCNIVARRISDAEASNASAVSSLTATVTQQGGKLTAETQRIDGLYTAVGDANAAIQNEATARANADGALSQQLQTTQSSLGNTNASVQQVATAQANMKGMLNAQYTMRVQINSQVGVHHWGGFGIGINEQNGVVQSAFVVYSDQFVLLNANGGGLSSPFSVVGGQTFVDDAYIRAASITNAKIADAAISNAKIANGAITSAKIGVAEIDTLRIRGNAVTVPVSANNPTNALGAGVGQWQNLIAVGVQMDEGGFITAQYSCYQGFGSGIRRYQFQMDVNGLVIAEGGGDWADGFPNLMGSIGVAPGYFIITVKWWGENSGVGVKNHNLFAMGTKR
ncbi:TipJ family phage tail tip protein [Pseudomonas monteilii]|uniref:TipJ family phage tail tip protein n=1 Tax=Pseudomonas monteilii TaxID=76759 RepID=UPI003D07A35A